MYDIKKEEIKKVCLMYSGGLDTSCMLKWIQDEYNAQIVTFTADLGQEMVDPSRFKKIEEKAKKAGAVATYTVDMRDEFVNDYLVPVIKANGYYQGTYPLSTAVGRYIIAKKVVEIAVKEGCDAVAHGSTGMGNDQVRFDVHVNALAPNMKIIRPIIEWGMGRNDEIKYAAENNIEIDSQYKKYSIDENLFGRSTECDILEHPDKIPPQDAIGWLNPPEKWPDEPEILKIGFKQGVPVSFNDKEMIPREVIEQAHSVGIKHGCGWIQSMEDRTVGLKSRETYELPAAEIIMSAHKALEKYVCTKHENSFKGIVDQKWTELAYEGLWVDPLMDALNAFINEVNVKVTGWAKVRVFKGKAEVVAQDSPYGIYSLKLATYDTSGTFNQRASYGFIELHSLTSRMGYQAKKRALEDNK
ncbi:MAG: argininosuccinate synthase [archaeon]|nr:argininosuccinate synthase [archaeon]